MNGPSIAGHATQFAVAWFTHPESRTPTVQLALSADNGTRFSLPIAIGGDRLLGRPAVAVLEDGSAFLCWLREGEGHSQLRATRVMPDGRMVAAWTIAKVSSDGRRRQRRDCLLDRWAWATITRPRGPHFIWELTPVAAGVGIKGLYFSRDLLRCGAL